MHGPDNPSKVGAGLLICCEGDCLLLRRSAQCGNPGTWGLPGGNADAEDAGELLATAVREAGEEVGGLPEGMQVLGQVCTRRGKNKAKHYTVIVAAISPAARAAYSPALNEEHTHWRWLPLRSALLLAGGEGGAGAGPGPLEGIQAGEPPVVLHPVVRLALGEHRAEVLALLPGHV